MTPGLREKIFLVCESPDDAWRREGFAAFERARSVAGRTMTASEILAEIERDVVFFDESGGGVTFTGGEPLAQPELLEADYVLGAHEPSH